MDDISKIVNDTISKTLVEPRPYQRRIVQKAVQMYLGQYEGLNGSNEDPSDSIMVESPTGSGKTVMGLLALKSLQAYIPDLQVGWIAMRRNLLSQAAKENHEKGIDVDNISFVSMFEREPEALVEASASGKPVIMVIDEAQHDAATSMAHLHNIIKPSKILGLTATPFRTDRMKLCFSKVIKDAGIHQLIQDGFLSRFDHYSIPDWSVETVAAAYVADPERWGKSIFYFNDTDRCFQLQNMLRSFGFASEVVTGSSNCEKQLEMFKTGQIQILINCMKLTEGFDEPSIKTAFVRDSGKGCTMQMGGRAFRKHADIPVKNIVQSRNTKWPFIKTAMPVMQYIWQNGQWASLTVNPRLNQINEAMRVAIAQTQVEMPKFVTERSKKKVTKIKL